MSVEAEHATDRGVPSELAAHGFIVVCGMPFGGEVSWGDTQLARALARRHPVLVIDRPLPVRAVRTWRDTVPRPVQVAPRLTVVCPPGAPGSTLPATASLTDAITTAVTNRFARTLLGPRRILINFSTMRGTLSGIERDLSVYWQRDALHEPSTEFLRRHHQLLDRSDLVTGVSEALVRGRAPERSAVVPNGADVDHFASPRPRPPELADIEGPIIGFTGALSWRFDSALVTDLARLAPDWTFVLIGEARDCRPPSGPNIRLLGPRPYRELPSFTQHFDVGFIPYVDNAFNRASHPLKALEYLASGTPVVSTPIPSLANLAPAVRLAASAPEMVAALGEALADRDPEGARALAVEHHWDRRVDRLHELIIAAMHRPVDNGRPLTERHQSGY